MWTIFQQGQIKDILSFFWDFLIGFYTFFVFLRDFFCFNMAQIRDANIQELQCTFLISLDSMFNS